MGVAWAEEGGWRDGELGSQWISEGQTGSGKPRFPLTWLRSNHSARLMVYTSPLKTPVRTDRLFWTPIAMNMSVKSFNLQSVMSWGIQCPFALESWSLLFGVWVSFLLPEVNDFSPLALYPRHVSTTEPSRHQEARFSRLPIEVCQCWFYTFLLVFNEYFVLAIKSQLQGHECADRMIGKAGFNFLRVSG